MEFSVKSGSPEKQRSACVVVGVFEPRRLSPVAEQLDKISDGYLSSLLRRGDLEGKPGQMLLLHQVPGVLSERVLLVGCGKERELDERQYKQIINKTITTLNETGSMEAVCFLTELHVKGRDTYWKVRQAVETTKAGLYSFDQFKTNKAEPRRHGVAGTAHPRRRGPLSGCAGRRLRIRHPDAIHDHVRGNPCKRSKSTTTNATSRA